MENQLSSRTKYYGGNKQQTAESLGGKSEKSLFGKLGHSEIPVYTGECRKSHIYPGQDGCSEKS